MRSWIVLGTKVGCIRLIGVLYAWLDWINLYLELRNRSLEFVLSSLNNETVIYMMASSRDNFDRCMSCDGTGLVQEIGVIRLMNFN